MPGNDEIKREESAAFADLDKERFDGGVCPVCGEDAKKVRKALPDENVLFNLAELFKIFGDSTRIRILYTLSMGEMCVCDIAEVLDMSISAVSHQLRILRQSDLVGTRRDGKNVIYFLADDHVDLILSQGFEHITEG